MAKKSKQLKLNFSPHKDICQEDYKIHLDRVDHLFAKEHYGFYLMISLTKGTSNLSPRMYLSYKHKAQYFEEKAKTNSAYKKAIRKSSVEIFEENENYMSFIQDFISKKISKELRTYQKTRSLIIGLSVYIEYLKKINKIYTTLNEIKTIEASEVYNYHFEFNKVTTDSIRSLDLFFSELDMTTKQIKISKTKKKLPNLNKPNKEKLNIPSALVYQLVYSIKDNFKNTKQLIGEYQNWCDEFKSNSFITKNDLLKTIFDIIEEFPNRKNNRYVQLLSSKLRCDFGINADFLFYTNIEINNMFSLEQQNHMKLKKIDFQRMSLEGRNINVKNEKYAFYWMMEIFPEYPHSNYISEKYKDINQQTFKNIRTWIRRYFNIDLGLMDKRMFPQINDIYPLYLLLLIATGVNQEVLKSWEIRKNENEEYVLDADDLDMFTVISSVKERSNSNISVVLQNNSIEKRYLDFYIKWSSPIYSNSQNKKVFQYMNTSGGLSKKYQEIDKSFLSNVKSSPTSLFKKYEVINQDGNRIYEINHTEIRKSHNYQDYLKGKKEFERQLRKNHESGDTTKIYYENQNHEWEDGKKHKIALSQNLLVGIFKGEISREEHKTVGLFYNGPMADCKNNKSPTFRNAPVLKENEVCSDWCKCLTECNKSFVITKIHGPVIVSWINYLNKEREKFIRIEDWNKEYLEDYEAANDVLSRFPEDDIIYCNKEAYKYDNFVKMKFLKTIKTTG